MSYDLLELYIIHSLLNTSIIFIFFYIVTYSTTIILSYMISTLSFLYLKTHVINSIVLATKFSILIAIMIFIRGGIPRYRYDFLTKIGWIKFLSLILSVFIVSILITYLF